MKAFIVLVAVATCVAGGLAVYFFLNSMSVFDDEVSYTALPSVDDYTRNTEVKVVDEPWRRSVSSYPVPAAPIVDDAVTVKLTDDFYKLTEDDSVYAMYYYEATQSLTILLYQTPLTFARALAERKLRSLFSLSEAELCAMDIVVMTNTYVEPRYAGGNLGLSFCEGSILLE